MQTSAININWDVAGLEDNAFKHEITGVDLSSAISPFGVLLSTTPKSMIERNPRAINGVKCVTSVVKLESSPEPHCILGEKPGIGLSMELLVTNRG